ncbi:unnamed protein product [Chilo suppressalis]|uniref:BED-type domain-containing protein n=1 Tax=Chilo suppressalis TaxID=168631 RepID=A0ABN8B6A1_CHISP|nr:unnamed protein product [Chilo suppressalis]
MPRRTSYVWQYYQLLSDENNKKRVVCIYCNTEYKNALATRLKLHLSTCLKCPAEVKNKFYTEKTSSKLPLPRPSLSRTDEYVPTVESPLPSTTSSCEINVSTCISVNRNDSEPYNIPKYSCCIGPHCIRVRCCFIDI